MIRVFRMVLWKIQNDILLYKTTESHTVFVCVYMCVCVCSAWKGVLIIKVIDGRHKDN